MRIAAAGDVHASEATRERIEESFARVQGEADLVLLAGDLTTHGEPEQAAVLADACRACGLSPAQLDDPAALHIDRARPRAYETVDGLQEVGPPALASLADSLTEETRKCPRCSMYTRHSAIRSERRFAPELSP